MRTVLWFVAFIVSMAAGGGAVTVLLVWCIPFLPAWLEWPWAFLAAMAGIVTAWFIAKLFLGPEARSRGF